MLFKDLEPGKKFILCSGKKIIETPFFLKLDCPVITPDLPEQKPFTAVEISSGKLIRIPDNAEVILIH